MVNRFFPILFTLVIIFSRTYSQSFQHDSLFVKKAVRYCIEKYTSAFQSQTGLSNGSLYKEPVRTNDQHPFFLSADWMVGSVGYNGDTFTHVPVLYDISHDKLITESSFNHTPIVLAPELVSWFSFSGSTFQWIRREVVNNSLPQTGYYEVLYPGTTKAIALRQKRMRERIESQKIEHDFPARNRYYVFVGNQYHEVKNTNSVLRILSVYKKPLKKFLRSQRLHFRDQPERVLVAVAEQFDLLKDNN